MHDERQSRGYYDTFSERYEHARHHGYHAWLDRRTVGLLRRFSHNARALEVGCGTGLLLRDVAPTARHAVGLDLSHGMLQLAQRRRLTVVHGSATAIPFADASFDLVYSFKVLAHVPDIRGAVAEMARVTRPGGHLVLDFYNRHSLRHLVRRLRPPGRIGDGTDETHVFTRFDGLEDIRTYLPPSVRLQGVEGFRVATLLPQVFALPAVGRAWARLEDALSASPLRQFGGFLVVVLEKTS